MTFKKGDKVRTEDGSAGVILFIDKGGLEAQVALARISTKIRTETLQMFEPDAAAAAPAVAPRKAVVAAAKKRQVQRRPKA